jgi:hypothetical protein
VLQPKKTSLRYYPEVTRAQAREKYAGTLFECSMLVLVRLPEVTRAPRLNSS